MLGVGLPLALMVRSPKTGETTQDEQPTQASRAEPEVRGPAGAMAGKPGTSTVVSSYVEYTVGEALRTSTYWLLAAAIGLRLAGQQILIVHMVPILVTKGVGEATAASLVAVMSLIRLPSVIGAGFLADLWSRQGISALAMAAGTLTATVVIWGPNGLATGVAFAVLFAGAQASNAITWALVGHYFGRKNYASLRGGVTLVQSLMSTGGPIVAGWVFDQTGNYTGALVGVGIIYALSAIIFWGLRTPVKRSNPHI